MKHRGSKPNATLYVVGAHIAIVVALIAGGAFKGCVKKPEKPTVLAVVGIGSFSPAPAPTIAEPTPVEPPTRLAPPPPPEPVKPKPVKPPDPVKPPPKPLNSVDAIREKIKNQKTVVKKEVVKPPPVKPPPVQPPPVKPPTTKEIEDLLFKDKDTFDPNTHQQQQAADAQARAAAAAAARAADREMDMILGMLKGLCDSNWQKPIGLSSSAGEVVSITFTLDRSGRVISRRFKRRSNIAAMNESAMAAADRITFVRAFPSAFEGREENFTIEFELTPQR